MRNFFGYFWGHNSTKRAFKGNSSIEIDVNILITLKTEKHFMIYIVPKYIKRILRTLFCKGFMVDLLKIDHKHAEAVRNAASYHRND